MYVNVYVMCVYRYARAYICMHVKCMSVYECIALAMPYLKSCGPKDYEAPSNHTLVHEMSSAALCEDALSLQRSKPASCE